MKTKRVIYNNPPYNSILKAFCLLSECRDIML